VVLIYTSQRVQSATVYRRCLGNQRIRYGAGEMSQEYLSPN